MAQKILDKRNPCNNNNIISLVESIRVSIEQSVTYACFSIQL